MEMPPQQPGGHPTPPGFNPFGNLPPEVALVIDGIIARMVKKVEPEIQEIGRILRQHGSEGLTVQMGVKPAGDTPAVKPELGILTPYPYLGDETCL